MSIINRLFTILVLLVFTLTLSGCDTDRQMDLMYEYYDYMDMLEVERHGFKSYMISETEYVAIMEYHEYYNDWIFENKLAYYKCDIGLTTDCIVIDYDTFDKLIKE